MHACTHTCTHTRMHASMRTHALTHTHTHTHMDIYLRQAGDSWKCVIYLIVNFLHSLSLLSLLIWAGLHNNTALADLITGSTGLIRQLCSFSPFLFPFHFPSLGTIPIKQWGTFCSAPHTPDATAFTDTLWSGQSNGFHKDKNYRIQNTNTEYFIHPIMGNHSVISHA